MQSIGQQGCKVSSQDAKLLGELMDEKKHAIESEIKGSNLKEKLANESYAFSFGALAGSFTGDLTSAIVGGSITAAGQLFLEWAKFYESKRLIKPVINHYAAFYEKV